MKQMILVGFTNWLNPDLVDMDDYPDGEYIGGKNGKC